MAKYDTEYSDWIEATLAEVTEYFEVENEYNVLWETSFAAAEYADYAE